MYRYSWLFYTSMILFSLFSYGYDLSWYKQEVSFSNFRDKGRFDYSTNAVVSNYYCRLNGEKDDAVYLRKENLRGFVNRLVAGDTLKVGIDYYALTGIGIKITIHFFGDKFVKKYFNRLNEGGVVRLKVWANDYLYYQEY